MLKVWIFFLAIVLFSEKIFIFKDLVIFWKITSHTQLNSQIFFGIGLIKNIPDRQDSACFW